MSTMEQRWGEETLRFGFTGVPNVLLRINSRARTNRERISPAELFVLLVILSHWINPRKQPSPSIERISRYTGLSGRHVRRLIKSLQEKDYLASHRLGELDGRRNSYNPRPLVEKLHAAANKLDTDLRTAQIDETITRLEIADRLGLFSLNDPDPDSGSAEA